MGTLTAHVLDRVPTSEDNAYIETAKLDIFCCLEFLNVSLRRH